MKSLANPESALRKVTKGHDQDFVRSIKVVYGWLVGREKFPKELI